MLQKELKALQSKYPDVIFGYTKTDFSPYAAQYSSAMVFAVPYGEQLSLESYTEEVFDKGIKAAKLAEQQIIEQAESILIAHHAAYWVPPMAQKDEKELLAAFSFKFAAVNAGLGWIGKNDVVITNRYGPRVRLSAILIDELFDYGKPYVKSECPENCSACVDICPCKALKNQLWTIDSKRADIIDYHKCNRMRSAFVNKLGRKSACGLCMTVCPIGR